LAGVLIGSENLEQTEDAAFRVLYFCTLGLLCRGGRKDGAGEGADYPKRGCSLQPPETTNEMVASIYISVRGGGR